MSMVRMPMRWVWAGLLAVLLTTGYAAEAAERRVVFVAGGPSHGFASHEHAGGSRVLAETIEQAFIGIETEVVAGGWPADAAVFEGADAIVIFADGGGGHPALGHMDQLAELMDAGVGLVCLHYAVEVPRGEPGDAFLDWLGGYFETDWSVNPHWTAEFAELPDHPIARGVQPFTTHDEWYYHMRFRDGMEGVTPILTAMPPEESLDRPDGSHSNNPHVREAVLERGEPQHTAWAYERADGGRSFGFTGGHYHWNWGQDDFRRLVANAIVWSSGAEVPSGGVPLEPINVLDLAEVTDDAAPASFDPQSIQRELDQANGRRTPLELPLISVEGGEQARPAFASDVISADTPGHAIDITVDVADQRHLVLEVDDAGDGFGCDWANWIEPRLIDSDGNETPLTEIEWQSAHADWGDVNIDANADGGPLRVDGRDIAFGIGTHANSTITYALPQGHDYQQLVMQGGLDEGGTEQGCGSTVRFLAYTSAEDLGDAAGVIRESRDPEHAVKQLDVAEGLEVTLFASEPMITNPTNIHVDHRGRVWVADVQNYRGNQGTRPEGDRILVLEDTNGDGKADEVTTFYQGNDIDSILGLTVLGNKVIASASPYVFIFHDDNDDGTADRKEVLFRDTGIPQHDHSAHAFVFGPDGKYYWNFGDTGRHVHDADGDIIVDIFGHEVRDDGSPYRKGMIFRHDPDGSNFEVLGHNFRNPYEVTVDSFGNVWQSDNDDDGNRGCRINFIFEYGNYGYHDERTGAHWNADGRLARHPSVPHRHWHLRDPGVVPNLLQTWAGSPAGITFYEGDRLPAVFHNQMIHTDPGPRVVRAYPVMPHGAGYQGRMVDLIRGTRDSWFRPVDVEVAPDASLFVADWYDPGVGGHAMGDLERGRIFRVAPVGEGDAYNVPQFDFDSAEGAAEALKSPNFAVRYLAWNALHEMGEDAEPVLLDMYADDVPEYRARALWLLSKIEGRAAAHIDRGLTDDDANIRMTALRAARQSDEVELADIVGELVEDESAAVRREAAIALRQVESDEAAAQLWAALAAQHQAGDRWSLEALGIGAHGRWEPAFDAWLSHVGSEWDTPAGHEIVWRSRAPEAAAMLRQVIVDPRTPDYRLAQLVRGLDFHEADARRKALVALLAAEDTGVVELAVGQLDDVESEAVQQAVASVVEAAEPAVAARLIDQFDLRDRTDRLSGILRETGDASAAATAAATLARWEQHTALREALAGADETRVPVVLQAIGATGDDAAFGLLTEVIIDADHPLTGLRPEAVRALGRTHAGQQQLLAMLDDEALPGELHFAAGNALYTSADADVRERAAALLPRDEAATDLPPIAELVEQRGDRQAGEQVFNTLCFACHQVDGQGIAFGPDLSTIGDKFGREGMYVTVLDPNAGIGFNYRGQLITLADGSQLLGIVTGETADGLTLRMMGGTTTIIAHGDIADRTELDQSLMPANLAEQMTEQELVDLIEYLTTLTAE